MSTDLEKYLLEAQGKNKEELSSQNPYREIGFDKDKKRLGWIRVIPFQKIKESLEEISVLIGDKENFVFVGMGGSINGIKTLFSLFKECSFYTLDSLDPTAIKEMLNKIKGLDKTLIVPISKSGTTQETQLLAHTLKELFSASAKDERTADGKQNWQKHFLWLSDSAAFDKLDHLGWQGVAKFPIQFDAETDIGGRFSCPHTVIFFLPLFLLLGKDFKKLERIYDAYISLQKNIRAQAYRFADKYKDSRYAYFLPSIRQGFSERLSSWIVQLFQESLGSKKENLAVKTICSSKREDDSFLPLSLKLKINNPVVSLMAEMYFFQIFIAFYSAFKKVNFVDQDFVEKYKEEMRKLEGEKSNNLSAISLERIANEAKKKNSPSRQFIEVVLYFYPNADILKKVKNIFNKTFKDKRISVFVGSDWNHHSYQAAFADKDTFYVFITLSAYNTKLPFISAATLKKNVETLRLISKATYLTLKNKSVLYSFSV
jgi:hypothetical protein